MESPPVDWTKALGALEELRQELSRLGERIAALEAAGAHVNKPVGAAAPRRPGSR